MLFLQRYNLTDRIRFIMDSMTSLNRSLPSSSNPSEELIRVFRTAAFSVTSLYKEAITGQKQARAAGYQDALDDLLSFLDSRNLGVGDGEGWAIRQWATERLEDRPLGNTNQEQQSVSDSEEEKEQEKEKSPSPVQAESSPIHQPSLEDRATEPEANPEPPKTIPTLPTSETFSFQSAHPYPRDIEMQVTENVAKRETSPRATRQVKKHSKHKPFSTKILGTGGGSKRKLPFGEFFDISGIGENNDNGKKSSKRGRTS
jgi:hypothetical protein